jgi:Fe-S cluster biogenesis protein NfuA
MDPKSLIESALVDVEPMLRAAGRSVAVKEASDTHCVVELKGFCGDCACSGSYMEGIQDLVREKIPSIKNIEFVQS